MFIGEPQPMNRKMTDDILQRIETKLDLLLKTQKNKPSDKCYLTARDVEQVTGLDHRTILNRSNLDPDDPRFIPSIRLGSRRKYFERKVIERLFHLK